MSKAEELTEFQRDCLYLYDNAGWTQQQIADKYRVSQAAVSRNLKIAIRAATGRKVDLRRVVIPSE